MEENSLKTIATAALTALAILLAPAAWPQAGAYPAKPIRITPDELAAHLKSEVQRWGRVIKERGMRAE